MNQLEMICLDQMVLPNHRYRRFMKVWDFNKVAITPANLTDAQGMKHVCPSQGAIYADKGYTHWI